MNNENFALSKAIKGSICHSQRAKMLTFALHGVKGD